MDVEEVNHLLTQEIQIFTVNCDVAFLREESSGGKLVSSSAQVAHVITSAESSQLAMRVAATPIVSFFLKTYFLVFPPTLSLSLISMFFSLPYSLIPRRRYRCVIC